MSTHMCLTEEGAEAGRAGAPGPRTSKRNKESLPMAVIDLSLQREIVGIQGPLVVAWWSGGASRQFHRPWRRGPPYLACPVKVDCIQSSRKPHRSEGHSVIGRDLI